MIESWAIWTIVCALFGMAGFWGGVLQHAHSGPSDGGTLPNYPRIISETTTAVFVQNTIVQTTVFSINIPANSVLVSKLLNIEANLTLLQNTGVNRTEPTIAIIISGVFVAARTGAFSIVSVFGQYPINLQVKILARDLLSQTSVTGMYTLLPPEDLNFATPLVSKAVLTNLVTNIDWTIDNLLELVVVNQFASSNYLTTLRSAKVFIE